MEDEGLTEVLPVRLSPEQKAWLKAKGRELERTMAGVVRRMIDLERRKEVKD
jgi:predicted DNA-binding protein